MDTHNKRINYLNRFNLGHIGLTPNGSVSLDDTQNYIWLPFFFTYGEPEPEVEAAAVNSRIHISMSVGM